MAKELFIVFLYDTEVRLREEEDPQTAVVFFHPSWVNANQRMALCGQLIGVTQFLAANFNFPYTISLQNGKFAMKRLGRFILCVGTDHNIPQWVLEKRCETLYNTVQFFHNDLSMFSDSVEQKVVGEKLVSAMEVYLPVLLYPGSFFSNNLTLRLPKSASSIFLEAAQVLEWLQSNEGVHGGAIFYQNKVVMSQLSADVTKQIVVTDPYRIKIPAENLTTSFQLPSGVQLIIVYVDEPEFDTLSEERLPPTQMNPAKHSKNAAQNCTESSKWSADALSDRAGIFTVVEEDIEVDGAVKKAGDLSRMPDLVKDTVKTVKQKLGKKKHFCTIKVESYIVDSLDKSQSWCSSENLVKSQVELVRYCSFAHVRNTEDKIPENTITSTKRSKRSSPVSYYNTISDPINPWFRDNGLPASKSLHDHQIRSYCRGIDSKDSVQGGQPTTTVHVVAEGSAKRPTSIALASQDTPKKRNRLQKSLGLLMDLKREFSGIFMTDSSDAQKMKDLTPQSSVRPDGKDIPLTPLMSKLSLLDLSQRNVPANVITPAASLRCITDEKTILADEVVEKLRRQAKRKPRRQKATLLNQKRILKRTVMFVFGHQNISVYLLLTDESEKDEKLINNLWDACTSSIIELETHFQECLESMPQAQQALNVTNESYNYLQLHATWETIQHGGTWSAPHVHLLNTMHSDLLNDSSITDVTVRLDDSIVYGSQMGSSQLFYQQSVPTIAGLPMPSDLMGIVSLKAKRRLERDHSMLIV